METVSVSKWISDSNMKLLQKARIKSVLRHYYGEEHALKLYKE